jgi:multisubunit Na+/H+ antiporter MnhG subunit
VSWRAVAGDVLLFAGTGLCVVATLGVVVMRDWQDRLHYVGLSSYGVFLLGLAILVRESFSLIGDKALATGVLAVVAGAVMAHVTGRSGRIRQLGDWRRNVGEEEREG